VLQRERRCVDFVREVCWHFSFLLVGMVKKDRHLEPLPVFDEAALTTLLEENNFKRVHVRTIQKYLLRSPGFTK